MYHNRARNGYAALATIAVTAFADCLVAGSALAATAAGSIIRNEAKASYQYDGATNHISSNVVELRVDELLDVTLSSLSPSPVPALSTQLALPFTLANIGNGSEAWTLAAETAVAGDFTPVFQGFAIDSDGNGEYDPGRDQSLGAGAPTPQLAAESTRRVFAIFEVPGGLDDGLRAEIRVSTQSTTGSGTPGTAFAGQGDGGSDAMVGATGAAASALAVIETVRSSFVVEKSFTITDPYGGQRAMSGAHVRYTLVIKPTGTRTLEGAVLSDAIPQGTRYLPGSLVLDGNALSDSPDGDAGHADAQGIAVTIMPQNTAETHTVTFDVLVS